MPIFNYKHLHQFLSTLERENRGDTPHDRSLKTYFKMIKTLNGFAKDRHEGKNLNPITAGLGYKKLNSQWHKAFDGKGKDSSGYQNAKRIETYFELATMMRLHWFLTALIDFPTQVAKDRTASAIEPIFHEKLSYLQDHKLFKKANLLESIERKKDRLEESLRSIPETSPLKAYAERYLHALEAALRYRMITTSDECRSPDLFQNYAVPDCICPLYEAPRPTPESSYVLYPASSSASAESAASAATPDAPRARPTIKREPPQFF